MFRLAGDVDGVLHNPTVPGGGGVPEAAAVRQEHVRLRDGEADPVRDGDFDGEECEDDGVAERGEWVLRAVADVAGDVVAGAGRRREQGGGGERREDRVAAHAVARDACSQRPPAAPATNYSGHFFQI